MSAKVMDPEIIQFLARRLGLSEQEVEALERGDTAAVIASRFGSDPALVPLLALVNQSESRVAGRADADETMDARPARPRRRARGSQPAGDDELELARRAARQLRRDLHSVDEIFRHLGHVFGACPACFGMSEDCGRCRGQGMPGSVTPLEEELLAWVEPALARLGLQVIPIPSQQGTGQDDDELH
jgi:hypothetical protein